MSIVCRTDADYEEIARRFKRGQTTAEFDGIIYRRSRRSEGMVFEAVDIAPTPENPDMDLETWRANYGY